MSDKRVKRGAVSTLFSAIVSVFCVLCMVCCALSGFVRFVVLDDALLASRVVDASGYLSELRARAEAELSLRSAYYDVPADVLKGALSDSSMRETAISGTRLFLSHCMHGGDFSELAPYPEADFSTAISEYLADLRDADGNQVSVDEDAVSQISAECAAVVGGICNPVSQPLLYTTLQTAIPQRLPQVLQMVSMAFPYLCCGVFLLFALLVLRWRKVIVRALFPLSGCLFCASSLLFALTVFCVPDSLFSTSALGASTLRSFLVRIPSALFGGFRLFSILLFAGSAVLLLFSVIARLRKEGKSNEN